MRKVDMAYGIIELHFFLILEDMDLKRHVALVCHLFIRLIVCMFSCKCSNCLPVMLIARKIINLRCWFLWLEVNKLKVLLPSKYNPSDRLNITNLTIFPVKRHQRTSSKDSKVTKESLVRNY